MRKEILIAILLLTSLSVAQTTTIPEAEHYPLPSTVTQTLTVTSAKQVDTNYDDGNVLYLYGKWVLIKDEVILDSNGEDGEQLSTSTFSKTFTWTFDQSGNYVYSMIIRSASREYDYTTHTWGNYVYETEGTAVYPFTVGFPEPTQPTNIFVGAWNWLADIFWDIIGFFI